MNHAKSDLKCVADEHEPRLCALCEIRERSICADLSPREMAQVERLMANRKTQKGTALVSEGEPNDCLYIVREGAFRLTKHLDDGRRQVTGFLFKGDFFGVRPTEASAYTAEALDDGVVCRFAHKYLNEIADAAPGLKDRLIARGQTEYHKAQDHIVLLGKKSAEERVLSFIDLVRRSTGATTVSNGVEVALPMSRQDIADYLGLRHETLSRTLAALKRSGDIIEASRAAVILPE